MTLSKKNVLIVEDEVSNYYLLETILKRAGVITKWVTDGFEAIDSIDLQNNFDAIFMDLRLPYLNGYEATRQIKQKKPALPIIAVTAYALNGDKEKAEAAGCDRYITKPYTKNQILHTLSEILTESIKKSENSNHSTFQKTHFHQQ